MSKQKKLDFDEELKKYLAYTQEQFQSPDMDSPNLRIEDDRIVDDEGADYTDWAKENFYEKDPNKMLDFPQGIRKAAWDAKSRQAQHLEDALTEGYELADTLDRTFNPESYAQRRSGRGAISMPVGGRAGMANLYRPQYEADMNEAFVAPKIAIDDKQQMVKSNDDYAERNKAKGYLGINKRDDGSVYYTGSEQVRQNLEKEIAEIKKQVKLEETLQRLDLANDPAWGAAKISFIYNGDRSGIDAIANRIEAKIGREFTAAENEKNRKSNLDIAKANKEAEDQAKKQDLDNAFASAQQLYEFALGDLEANKNDPKFKREVEKAKEIFRQAATKAGRLEEFNRHTNISKVSDPLWDEAGSTYGVTGQTGIKSYVDSIKDPKIKAAILRDLERSFNITEGDLGYSGAEVKINEDKAKAAEALAKKVKAVVKSYGKGDEGKKARDKAYDALSDTVKAKVIKSYKDGEYIIKRKGK